MVLVVVLVSSLVTLLIIIITSAIYLITLIVDESEDVAHDNLGIDAHDFTLTPVQSPLEAHLSESFAPLTGKSSSKAASSSRASKSNRTLSTNEDSAGLDAAAIETSVANQVADARPEDLHSALMNAQLLDTSQAQHTPPHEAAEATNKSSESAGSSSTLAPELGLGSWEASATAQRNLITSQIGSTAGKQLFDDFDTKEMQLGGTGLHWCKTRKSLDKLIKLGLPLEIVNKRQETALHVAVRRHKLQVLIGLLNHGANVECRNNNGETPLILACRVNDIFACQVLLVFDADCNNLDNSGHSARHYAASICDKHQINQQQLPSAAHLILAMLNEIGAKRCPVNVNSDGGPSEQSLIPTTNYTGQYAIKRLCSDGCSATGQYNGNSYNRWPNYNNESLYKRYMFADIIEKRLKSAEPCELCDENGRPCPLDKDKSRLLCIDGGGLRGVIVCQIMIEMEKHLKKPMVSYFDWIGGTSVGGFMACALALGINLRDLRRICFDVKDEVFNGTRPYNAKFLERVLKRTYGPNTRMFDIRDKKVAVTTVIADRDPCQLRFFRNYKSPANLLEDSGLSPERFNTMSGHSMVTRKNLTAKKSITIMANEQTPVMKTMPPTITKKPTTNTTANDRADNSPSTSTSSPSTPSSTQINESVPDDLGPNPYVWQAVRASSAAPFFFKPYGPYLDGGLIANNPTLDMLSEFNAYHKVREFISRKTRLNDRTNNLDRTQSSSKQNRRLSQTVDELQDPPGSLDFVVSLGTGRGKVIGRQTMIDFGQVASGFATVFSPRELVRSIRGVRDLFKKLMQQSCQTEEHILDRAQAWTSSLEIPYFRINPPLATIFSIDDKRDEQLINALWQTKLYMRAMRDQLSELGTILDGCNGDDDLE